MAGIEIEPLAPQEAIDAFRRKGYRVTFDWRDMEREEHSRDFTVAKVATLDLLMDIREAMDRAIAEGTTLRQFERDLTPILQEKGWWGRDVMVDPLTGEEREVQLGSPRRLQTIYDTNLRMSYAAGRWQQVEAVAARRPWLRYVAVLDERTRQQHRQWHNTVLRWDDPWWDTHFPPNGWNCRCTIQQLSDADLVRMGLRPSEPPDVTSRMWTNRRTGEVREVPRGIDPGFDYNVGRANLGHMRDVAVSKLDGAHDDLARETIAALMRGQPFGSYLRSPGQGAGWPVATGGLKLGGRFPTVTLPPATVQRQVSEGTLPGPADWQRVQAMIDAGRVTQQGNVRHVVLNGEPHVMEVETSAEGRIIVTSLRRVEP
ncbi:phage minor head protein [Paracoccus sp. P2]|uniref:phage head morphogenesis protein n=1 Tax=Paracoccus sp. P2 TaxID=3248840 RepID=UPI00391FB436